MPCASACAQVTSSAIGPIGSPSGGSQKASATKKPCPGSNCITVPRNTPPSRPSTSSRKSVGAHSTAYGPSARGVVTDVRDLPPRAQRVGVEERLQHASGGRGDDDREVEHGCSGACHAPLRIAPRQTAVVTLMVKWQTYDAAADGVPGPGLPRERRSAADPHPVRVPRAAPAIQGTEDSGHGGVLRIGARGQPRARRARAGDAARARRARRGRALSRPSCRRRARRSSGRDTTRTRASWRGCSTAWSADAAVGEPPVRGDVGRRPRHHGGGEPRRARGRRQDDRPEHPPAVRAGREPVHHRRTALRVPLLLHAQVLVCVPREGAGDLSRRFRHAATSCSRSSRSCRPTSCRRRSP